MKIALLTSQRVPRQGSVTRECLDLLTRWGIQVDARHTVKGAALAEIAVEYDLYLLASPSCPVMSMIAGLVAQGARCLNDPEMVRTCKDRILAAMLLSSAGVPTPRTRVIENTEDLLDPLRDGPVVLRTVEVNRLVEPKVLWDVDDVIDLPLPYGVGLVQEFHPTDRHAHRLYRIGNQTFAVKTELSCRGASGQGMRGDPVPVTDEMRDIADRVAHTFGSELFGLYLTGTEGRLQVVDVDPFPRLNGVPDAALRLADYIYARGMELVEEGHR